MDKSCLTKSYRLPCVLRSLISPIYTLDSIKLTGRPAAAQVSQQQHDEKGPLSAAFRAIWQAPEGLFLVLHEGKGDGKRSNLELQIIKQMLAAREGQTNGVEAGEAVGIIAPHKLQRADLRDLVADMDGVCAKTVDEYQVCAKTVTVCEVQSVQRQ